MGRRCLRLQPARGVSLLRCACGDSWRQASPGCGRPALALFCCCCRRYALIGEAPKPWWAKGPSPRLWSCSLACSWSFANVSWPSKVRNVPASGPGPAPAGGRGEGEMVLPIRMSSRSCCSRQGGRRRREGC